MRRVLPAVLLGLFACIGSKGQSLSIDPFVGGAIVADPNVPGAVAADVTNNVFLLLPTVPVSFVKLERDSTDILRMGAAMKGGAGLTFVLGKANFVEDGIAELHPWLFFGASIVTGFKEDANGGEASSSTGLMLFAGLHTVSVSYTMDFDGATYFGLSTKLDVITNLASDLYIPFARW